MSTKDPRGRQPTVDTGSSGEHFGWKWITSGNQKEIYPKRRTFYYGRGTVIMENGSVIKRKEPQECFRFREAEAREFRVKGKGRTTMSRKIGLGWTVAQVCDQSRHRRACTL